MFRNLTRFAFTSNGPFKQYGVGMQLHTGADHFGNVIKHGTIKRGCS